MEMKNKNANTMMWVSYWIEHVDPSIECSEVWAEQQDNGKWRCDIDLPLINKVVTSISSTQVNAMKNASDRAAKLINEYMKNHPELKIRNMFKGKEWTFEEDEYGNFRSAGLSERARAREEKQMQYIMEESLKAVRKAIDRIKKVNGSDKGIFIQVMDKAIFGKDADKEKITLKIWETFQKEYNYEIMGVNWAEFRDSVIAIGYTFPEKD